MKYFISFYAEAGEKKQIGNAVVTSKGKMKTKDIEDFEKKIERIKGLDYISVISFQKI